MILVIAILGILSSVVLVSWGNRRSQQEVALAAREFEAALRQAQGYAMAGKLVDPTRIPCDFRVEQVSATQYRLAYTHDRTVAGACTGPTATIQTFTLASGVQFDSPHAWASGKIVFSLPKGEGAASNIASVMVKKGSNQQKVCIPRSANVGAAYSGGDTC